MTGYARAEGLDGTQSWVWDLRSVNGRSLDLRLKLPPGLEQVEAEVRTRVGERLRRGNVSASLQMERTRAAPAFRVNRAVLEQYLAVAHDVGTGLAAPSIDGLLALPGVIERTEPEDVKADDAARDRTVLAALAQALDGLVAARDAEGRRLHVVLDGLVAEIEELRLKAIVAAARQPEALRSRMVQQIEALFAGAVPPERIVQEAAVLAARADVREELDRLGAHVEQARDLLAEGAAVGRRLDFLTQEFLREANTLCSKSADIELTRLGLELKAAIERLREQVQNVE
ncbi:YicC/YloC family endoribonuclease [Zavarzinia sp. CC-PAN008]|uniref:YicC/YloC family endoribonuclease n=1 Tax=Zavarzinia sp. CC-PAN008 TaxID=3243332 RepID=UPI003F7463D0